jgi:hypothetical protein
MSTEPRKDESEEAEYKIRSLPKELWPLADRIAWEAACRPGVRLTRGGAASHLRPVTQSDLAKRYGYFLDFLSRSRRLDPQAEAAAHVTLENVEPYMEELKKRVSSVTVYGSIHKLRRITQLIAPEGARLADGDRARAVFSEAAQVEMGPGGPGGDHHRSRTDAHCRSRACREPAKPDPSTYGPQWSDAGAVGAVSNPPMRCSPFTEVTSISSATV